MSPVLPTIVTKRDEQILLMLAKVRYVTRLDVAHYCFTPSSETYAGARLARLSGESGVLVSFRLPTTRGNPEKIFALSGRGAALLRVLHYPEAASLHPAKLSSLSYSHLSHALLLTRVVTASTYWCRRYGEFALLHSRVSYELAGSQGLSVIPDAWMLFERRSDGRRFAIWWEVDLSSTYQEKFGKQLAARLEFLKGGGYEKVFGVKGVLFAFVVAGPSIEAAAARRESLCRWISEILKKRGMENWAGLFRLVSVERKTLFATPLFTNPIWHQPNVETPVCLFGP